jgi:hypothetical protein
MSRMWMVDPSKMCDNHLRGEHAEHHQLVGSIRNHPHGEAIIEGHAKKGQVDTSLIQQRHDELVTELKKRGVNHDSPMSYDDQWNKGAIDVKFNKRDLSERCDECLN